ncbi:fanconi-associated nuclease 1-like [Tropilaelaps mercedesae]|uniref:Fanconi-associated nuclease n=1 Tax=Tropilaelaps mercedesae TaxID=418985 RepID=A0A1V9XVB2_9ACAR|nr:fanconi-associated nuclease 1-like [Tropilaelaps mercedesae]
MAFSHSQLQNPSSSRKRSPRKIVPQFVNYRSPSGSSQTEASRAPKTLYHFFTKQAAKAEATKVLQVNGNTAKQALVIDDSDDDEEDKSGRHLTRKLFSPSPTEKSGAEYKGYSNVGQMTNLSMLRDDPTQKLVPISSLNEFESGPSIQSSTRDGIKFPIGIRSSLRDPHVELINNTNELMDCIPEPQPSLPKCTSQNYEAQTFLFAYESSVKKGLFSQTDNRLLVKFFSLNESAQKLWLRLYQRKHVWILKSRISYELDNIDSLFKELVDAGFLYDKTHLKDMKILLQLLPQKSAIVLGRQFCDPKKCTTKAAAIEELTAHARRKDALFGAERIRHRIIKSGQKLVEQCYFVESSLAAAVTRVLTLISLGSHFDAFTSAADKNDHGVCNLFTINQFVRGKFAFPEYTVVDVLPILFGSPEDFGLYCDARRHVFRLRKLMETHNWDTAVSSFEEAYKWFMNSYTKEKFAKDASLPSFLHRFSYSHCLIRCLVAGAEIFERHKRYQDAVDLYYTVLSQTAFQQNQRGMYWNRLLLDTDTHLKLPRNSICFAMLGLEDCIAPQHKFDVYTRAKRLSERFRIALTQLEEFTPPNDAPIEIIDGQLAKRNIIGRRNVFATVDGTGERVVGPERVAVEYYLHNGYTNGVHGETRSIHMLFAVLCWDVLFSEPSESEPGVSTPTGRALTLETESQAIDRLFNRPEIVDISDEDEQVDETILSTRKRRRRRVLNKTLKKKKKVTTIEMEQIPHGNYFCSHIFSEEKTPTLKDLKLQKAAYINEFQSCPLDLGYPEFYLNRKRAIEEHLATLNSMSSEEIVATAKANYNLYSGRLNPLFDWELLNADEVSSLLACIPVPILVAIFRQLLIDFRFYRSGFPDLIMWNERTRSWKVVEVKGPGDILSTKQRYWMHFLLSLGVDCATCRVVATRSRKIRVQNNNGDGS